VVLRAIVRHWHYADGWKNVLAVLQDENKIPTSGTYFDKDVVGWHCHVYTDDDEFEKWMKENMKGEYDCTFRFNSGNPILAIHIKDDEDASLFKLKWL
jgi:hypothetical protein